MSNQYQLSGIPVQRSYMLLQHFNTWGVVTQVHGYGLAPRRSGFVREISKVPSTLSSTSVLHVKEIGEKKWHEKLQIILNVVQFNNLCLAYP